MLLPYSKDLPSMKTLDEQEKAILRALVRDPRLSDHAISEKTGVPAKTVSRKRRRLEEAGVLSYHTMVNMMEDGTGQFTTRHLYILKFRLGVTKKQIVDEIKNEPNIKSIFTELIFQSHIAEIDGHVSLLMLIDGKDDSDVVESMQARIIPSLRKNHGQDSIEEIQTLRVLAPIRVMRNYIPMVNMVGGVMKDDWPEDAIFVG
jgi:DNA-binding Lrp family transcriptional regulator